MEAERRRFLCSDDDRGIARLPWWAVTRCMQEELDDRYVETSLQISWVGFRLVISETAWHAPDTGANARRTLTSTTLKRTSSYGPSGTR
jgi:hypothetical protein